MPLMAMETNRMKYLPLTLPLTLLLFSGCAGSTGDINSPDPIIQGCSYIACAIVTHGILQIIVRK
jgi:hypothetical protein